MKYRKEYTSPEVEIVEAVTLNMLALSKETEVQMDDEEQMSKENRNDWNNIWGEM